MRSRDGHGSVDESPEPIEVGEDDEKANGDTLTSDKSDTEAQSHPAIPRQFDSYVRVAPDNKAPDPDGLEHSVRMDLKRRAISFILKIEPHWQETPRNNAGFDLYRGATMATATHWCEVKAMKGTLDDRSVGISRTQFEWADRHRDRYWLYVVERAGKTESKLVRIQDPVGKAKTFTFDRGWRAVAE